MISLLVSPGASSAGRELVLDSDERHHLRVRRSRPGDPVRLLDGKGLVASGRLLGEPGEGKIRIEAVERAPPPPVLGLAVGAGDRERFAWLVEKAGELGVTDIIPLESERTAGVGTRVRADQVEKLQRRALEAIKQSGAAWAPVIHPPETVSELLERHPGGSRWLADAGGGPLGSFGVDTPVWVAVGPEGGFSGAERDALVNAGWARLRLGSNTLRFETAAIAAAVLVSHARQPSLDS